MNVLGISTSTARGSAAVAVAGNVVGQAAYVDLLGHAERIFDAIERALAAAGLSRHDLDAVACDIGPGSFTGVRVGVASTKGICIALDIPAIGVGSLEAMAAAAFAAGVVPRDALAVPLLDAKRGELFVARYDSNGACVAAPALVSCTSEAFAQMSLGASPADVLVGCLPEGAFSPANSPARGESLDAPDAAWVARIGFARLAIAAGSVDELEPMYVRPVDALPMAARLPNGTR